MRSFFPLALLFSLATAGPLAAKKHHFHKANTHQAGSHQPTPDDHHASVSSRVMDQATPPVGAIVVDATGKCNGSFKTVQAGVNALSMTATTPQTIFIMAGTYREQVYIQPLKSPLIVQGETKNATSYKANTVTIINNISRNTAPSNDLTATVRNWTPNSKFYNLNIENDFGHTQTNGQNLALSAQATNQGYYVCSFIGFQDTILANTGYQLYAKCLIVGVVDFFFGPFAQAWLEAVDIRTFGKGYISASGRNESSNESFFVVNKSTVAALNSTVAVGSTYLGRPWKAFARVVFQNSELGEVVNPLGWSPWNALTPNTDQSYLGEFGNTGPGASTASRPIWVKRLTSAVTIESVLGSNWATCNYVDSTYMH